MDNELTESQKPPDSTRKEALSSTDSTFGDGDACDARDTGDAAAAAGSAAFSVVNARLNVSPPPAAIPRSSQLFYSPLAERTVRTSVPQGLESGAVVSVPRNLIS
ncbi:Protein of unknown function [Gryllus bimaculatus]|nr:Protein of unknown function [Gryllus bimaculatus]